MATWPGDPPLSIERYSSIERGDVANVSSVSMSLHTGTHMDAPLHYLRGGASIDQMPLSAVIGRARVLGIRGRKSIEADELSKHNIRRGDRILLKTHSVELSEAGAKFLVRCGIRMVGIGGLSIGNDDTHRILLSAGVWIVEGLDLTPAKPGTYDLICLPLRVAGADGAPARAILRCKEHLAANEPAVAAPAAHGS
jgi:arylformamidase